MDTNALLGGLMMLTGIADLAIARALGAKLTPVAKTALSTFGIFFALIGAAIAFGVVRVV